MAKRLNIEANATSAFRGARLLTKEFLKYSWLVILLKLIFMYGVYFIDKTYLANWYLIGTINDHKIFHASFHLYKYSKLAGLYFIDSIIFVCLLRGVLLGDWPSVRSIKIRKGGLWEDKIIATIPVYFTFGKRELIFAVCNCIPNFIVLFFSDLNVFRIISQDEVRYEPHSYFNAYLVYWVSVGFEKIMYAVITLAMVYIATADQVNFPNLRKAAYATLGNILRIAVINFFIFLPYYAFNALDEIIRRHLHHPFMFVEISDVQISAPGILLNIIWYACSFAWVIFAVNVYKNLAPSEIFKTSESDAGLMPAE